MDRTDDGRPIKMLTLIDEYIDYQETEQAALTALADARAAVETERARVLLTAYAENLIDGKNETVRKLQELLLIDNSNGLYWLGLEERKAAEALANAEISRKSTEAEISLVKAWLYSQGSQGGVK